MTKYISYILLIIAFNAPSRLMGASESLSPSFVRAIHQVESGGRLGAIQGDWDNKSKTYLAKGPFQIHKKCWEDAVLYNKSIKGKYEDCFQYSYSVKIMTSYLNRYGKLDIKSHNYENLAQLWNGGPNWKTNPNVRSYWKKVKKYIQK